MQVIKLLVCNVFLRFLYDDDYFEFLLHRIRYEDVVVEVYDANIFDI